MKSLRRLHAYCIGSAKSGTHSIAALFEEHYVQLIGEVRQSLFRLLFSDR